jgi:lysophospholipase L1-like esterase
VSDIEVRPAAIEAYVRGVAWPAGAGVTYPRANPADLGRLPADTWGSASLPAGVRLEVCGDATHVDIDYHAATNDLGYRGSGAGSTFIVYRHGRLIDEQPAVAGRARVRLALGTEGPDDHRCIIYLPEGMKPSITAIAGVDGTIEPAPLQPRWLAYGDSIVEGWIASGPAGAWPAIAGRTHGLDVFNLGYAGAARGEVVSAENVASVRADVISISHGTNCWTRIAHSVDQMTANTIAFLSIVRAGHPGIPIVVASPVVRPDAEDTQNMLRATLADLRAAMEQATQTAIDEGDSLISLVPGRNVLAANLLADGVHPGEDGHAVLADVFGNAVAAALKRS